MITVLALAIAAHQTNPPGTATFLPEPANDNKTRVVLLAGDEEYRSEEALPQLARILSKQFGFHCTVVFSIDQQGNVDPETTDNQPGIQALQSADLCVMMLRFRAWPDNQMAHFERYVRSGRPIIALRTSTHPFNFKPGSPYRHHTWNSPTGGFGKRVLGETWLTHWGIHGTQGTRAVPTPGSINHPVMKGVEKVFVTTDVYEAHPPEDATVLALGYVTASLKPGSPDAEGTKTTVFGTEQPVNKPPMSVVWTRTNPPGSGLPLKVTVTTMGSATDLLDEGFRRLLVNATFWSLGKQTPATAPIPLEQPYNPTPFGFGKQKKGLKPTDF